MSWPVFCLLAISSLGVNASETTRNLPQAQSTAACSLFKKQLETCSEWANTALLKETELEKLQRCIQQDYNPDNWTPAGCILTFSQCVIKGASEELRDVVITLMDCALSAIVYPGLWQPPDTSTSDTF